MLRYKGGQQVGKGTYWSLATGQRLTVPALTVLPGDVGVTYCKASAAVVLLAGPILGCLYVIFMPFFVIAAVLRILVGSVGGNALRCCYQKLLQVVAFAWSPSGFYLARRGHEKRADGPRGVSPKI